MKTIKKDILKVFITVIIINTLTFVISIKFQIYMTNNFSTNLLGENISVASASLNVKGYGYSVESDEKLEVCIFINNNLTRNEKKEVCLQGRSLDVFLSLPFILCFLGFFITSIYFVYKLNKILRNVNNSLDKIKNSLNNEEPTNNIYKYQEMNNIRQVVNTSISRIKRNRLLEKELINSIVHDIKTPLHIINGYNDMQSKSLSNNEFNTKIKEQIIEVNNVIDQTLDNNYFKKKDIDILFIINDLINSYKLIYEDIDFQIICKLEYVYFNVDIVTFKRIIINLMNNAISGLENKKVIKLKIETNNISIFNYGKKFTQMQFEKYIEEKEVVKEGLGLKIIAKNCEKNSLKINYKSLEKGTEVNIFSDD